MSVSTAEAVGLAHRVVGTEHDLLLLTQFPDLTPQYRTAPELPRVDSILQSAITMPPWQERPGEDTKLAGRLSEVFVRMEEDLVISSATPGVTSSLPIPVTETQMDTKAHMWLVRDSRNQKPDQPDRIALFTNNNDSHIHPLAGQSVGELDRNGRLFTASGEQVTDLRTRERFVQMMRPVSGSLARATAAVQERTVSTPPAHVGELAVAESGRPLGRRLAARLEAGSLMMAATFAAMAEEKPVEPQDSHHQSVRQRVVGALLTSS